MKSSSLIIFLLSATIIQNVFAVSDTDSLKSLLLVSKGIDKAVIYNNLSIKIRQQDPVRAQQYADQGMALVGNNNDSLLAELKTNAGIAVNMMGDVQQAIDLFNDALTLFSHNDDSVNIARMYNNIGVMYRKLGHYDEALNYYYKALYIRQRLKLMDDVTATMNNIAGLHYYIKEYNEAGKIYEKVLAYTQSTGDHSGEAAALNNLALVRQESGDYDQALQLLVRSLTIRRFSNDLYGIGTSLNNIGRIYHMKKDYIHALRYYGEAAAIDDTLGDQLSKANVLYNMAEVEMADGHYDNAIELAAQSERLADSLALLSQLKDDYLLLARCHYYEGNYQSAFEYREKHLSVSDSILNSESTRRIAELRTYYEFNEKQKEIKLLRQNEKINALRIEKQRAELDWQRARAWLMGVAIVLAIALLILFMGRIKRIRKHEEILKAHNDEINTKNKLIEEQNMELGRRNDDIMDSLEYAKHLQNAMLPDISDFTKHFSEAGILYRPKDIIGGDIYAIYESGGRVVTACIDCTGHGVPGALMSLLANNLLHNTVKVMGITNPASILLALHKGIVESLEKKGAKDKGAEDGMDAAICCFNPAEKKMLFSGANRPLLHIRNVAINYLQPEATGLGASVINIPEFSNQEISVESGDIFYMYTDGVTDIFGGAHNKKFMTARLKQNLIHVCHLPAEEQVSELWKTLAEWGGSEEPIDDMCLLALRV